jgi:hypothetical protein
MIEINVSADKPYFTQRNNQLRPMITCNTTSMVAALIYTGFTLPESKIYTQPEDNLTNFLLNDPRVDAEYQKLFPAEYKKYIDCKKDPKQSYPPNELHPILSYGTNLWMGKQVGEITKFRWDATVQTVLFETIKGRAVVQSGIWNKLHHVTCMVGFVTNQENIKDITDAKEIDLSQLDHIIMDDSFGDYHSGYLVQKGNDIRVTLEEYHSYVQVVDQDLKWAHFFII